MPELTDAQQRWKSHLDAAASSGMSVSEYARRHDLNAQSLYAARQRMRKAGAGEASTRFLRVERTEIEERVTTAPMVVRLPNGISLQLACGHEALPSLLRTLAAL